MDPRAVVHIADAVSFRSPCCMVRCNSPRRKRAEAPGALIGDNKRGDKGHDAMFLSSMRLERMHRGKPLCAHPALAPFRVYALEVAAERPENYFHLFHAFRGSFSQGLRAKKASEHTCVQGSPLSPIVRARCKHVKI